MLCPRQKPAAARSGPNDRPMVMESDIALELMVDSGQAASPSVSTVVDLFAVADTPPLAAQLLEPQDADRIVLSLFALRHHES